MSVREWGKLKYMNPEKFLVGLDELYASLPMQRVSRDIASLRRRGVRQIGEARRCAIFCYGISQYLGTKILFADHENADYDYVVSYVHDGVVVYVPLQMKEFVPQSINPGAELQTEIDKLRKYKDSADLVVAMHLNRTGIIQLSKLNLSALPIKELWFFGAKDASAKEWVVIGNLLNINATWHEFSYPGS
jgi:hypothetical protein